MRIDILSLFPDMFAPLKESIIKRAVDDGKVEICITNIRDFATPPHYKCDDEVFGGGAGMVMMCDPLFKAIESVQRHNSHIFYMSPRGSVFKQALAREYAQYEHIIIICGHYEGIDQRVIDYFNIQELSIGDYVLTGGEIPAMAVVDSIVRLIPDVIKKESTEDESFSNDLLEYNQYTRPAVYREMAVPDVILSGHHKKIAEHRLAESIQITRKNRPDLYRKYMRKNKGK